MTNSFKIGDRVKRVRNLSPSPDTNQYFLGEKDWVITKLEYDGWVIDPTGATHSSNNLDLIPEEPVQDKFVAGETYITFDNNRTSYLCEYIINNDYVVLTPSYNDGKSGRPIVESVKYRNFYIVKPKVTKAEKFVVVYTYAGLSCDTQIGTRGFDTVEEKNEFVARRINNNHKILAEQTIPYVIEE